jgi:ATP-dependent Clp protease ATP-binding subunit ClpC
MRLEGKEGTTTVTVDDELIREVVSEMTGVPLKTLSPDETARLLGMEGELQKKVIGQDEAVTAIARMLRKAHAGLKDPKRPIASLLFAGPTGVGKTLLAKEVAKFMFGDEKAFIEIDMSEYGEKHTAARLVGSPPGYVGHDEGGQLTEKVRRRPYQVILFDEIEKAHPDVWNMFLQILEEGRLTDGQGRVVDFKNTIIIMTSNVGAEAIAGGNVPFGRHEETPSSSYEEMKGKLQIALEQKFRPEFINRIDDVIVFRSLGETELMKIVDLELNQVAKRLGDRQLGIDVSPEAKAFIVKNANGRVYGGRAIRRTVERLVEMPLADLLLKGTFNGAKGVKVGLKGTEGVDAELVFEADFAGPQ